LAVFVVHSRRDPILALDPLRLSVIIREPKIVAGLLPQDVDSCGNPG
jgi:hypothetical protein